VVRPSTAIRHDNKLGVTSGHPADDSPLDDEIDTTIGWCTKRLLAPIPPQEMGVLQETVALLVVVSKSQYMFGKFQCIATYFSSFHIKLPFIEAFTSYSFF